MRLLNSDLKLECFFEKMRMGSLLMLDYDGTLAPFVAERMQAYPYRGVKDRLESLSKLEKSRILIVSGRSLSDLEILLDTPHGLELWGSHGLEKKLLSGEKIYAPVDGTLRKGLEQGIKVCRERSEEKYCEVKPYAVAVHWRGKKKNEQREARECIEPAWKAICSNYELEIHYFDGGLELRPKGWNKGNVVQEVLSEVSRDIAIAYLGDDLTDEEAFAALSNKGLKVLVRKQLRPTLADICLTPPEELLVFLDRWLFAANPIIAAASGES